MAQQLEGEFWRNTLRDRVKGRWERIETRTRIAFPDTIVLLNGTTSLIELKSKESIEEGLGTTPLQRHFLRQWCAEGGNAYLLARVGKEIFFVWGADVGGDMIRDEWIACALVHGDRTQTFDFDAMHRILGRPYRS